LFGGEEETREDKIVETGERKGWCETREREERWISAE
jgi:hypothetical protein